MYYRSIMFVLILFIAFLPGQVKAQDFVTDGLVSFWTFDSNTINGDVVMDVWGNNDGKIVDTEVVEAKIRQGLKFNGSSSLVDIAGDASLDITDAITIEAWIQIDIWQAEPNRNIIMSRYNAGANKRYVQFSLNPSYGPGVYLGISNGTAYAQTQLGSRKPEWVGKWVHLAFTWDKDEDGLARIYVDGQELESYQDQEIKEDELVLNDLNWTIGAMADIGRFFSGVMDEVRIYNRRLSDDEVLTNFEAETNSLAVQPTGKLATTWSDIKR